MPNSIIETLSQTGIRPEKLSFFHQRAQIRAVKALVGAMHTKLTSHLSREQIIDPNEEDFSYAAFFFVPKINGVIKITSDGLEDDSLIDGLFLNIHYRDDQRELQTPISLETAKEPGAVGKQEAMQLLGYTPQQLQLLAELVRSANPITSESYQRYFHEPKVPAGIEM